MGQLPGETDVGGGRVVYVVGSLGEVIKKILELESLLPKDTTAVVETAVLLKIVEEWPVTDSNRLQVLWMSMKMSFIKYKGAEQDIELILKSKVGENLTLWLYSTVADLFKRRNEIRHCIAEINKLSGNVHNIAIENFELGAP